MSRDATSAAEARVPCVLVLELSSDDELKYEVLPLEHAPESFRKRSRSCDVRMVRISDLYAECTQEGEEAAQEGDETLVASEDEVKEAKATALAEWRNFQWELVTEARRRRVAAEPLKRRMIWGPVVPQFVDTPQQHVGHIDSDSIANLDSLPIFG